MSSVNESTVQYTPRERKRKFANVDTFALVHARGTSAAHNDAPEKMGRRLYLCNPSGTEAYETPPGQQRPASYSVPSCFGIFAWFLLLYLKKKKKKDLSSLFLILCACVWHWIPWSQSYRQL